MFYMIFIVPFTIVHMLVLFINVWRGRFKVGVDFFEFITWLLMFLLFFNGLRMRLNMDIFGGLYFTLLVGVNVLVVSFHNLFLIINRRSGEGRSGD